MTCDQFWFDDPFLAVAYRRAYELRIEAENQRAWLQGLYNYNAMSIAINNAFSNKKQKYINKPIRLFPPTEDEKKAQIEETRRKLVERLNAFKDEFERRQKKKEAQ